MLNAWLFANFLVTISQNVGRRARNRGNIMEAAIDFSIWALFSRATLPVQLVMILLIGLSVWSWTIAINKRLVLGVARRRAAAFDQSFWSGDPLDELFDQISASPKGGSELIFTAGMTEWRRSHREDGAMIAGAQSRIERSMDVALSKQANQLQNNLGALASIGSVAPFIGLFGTVWGIMNAFIEIAAQQNTNLAVVAPGIAEALLATGLGLLAAIPAVVFYNNLSAGSDRLIASYEAFADEFSTILSRQLGG
jgi:biopolymer transport protein TolQ